MLQAATGQAMVAIIDFLYCYWDKLLYSLVMVIVALVLIRVSRPIMVRFGKERGLSPGNIGRLNAVIKYGVLLFAAVNVLGVYSFTYIYSLILSLGLISVVVALGSQNLISNLMGGVIVYLERPFHIGDIVKVGDNTGEVLGISFRTTALRGLNGLNIVVPNSMFLTVPIVNFTRTQSYLLKVPFVLPRTADVTPLADAIRQQVGSLAGIRSDLELRIYKSKLSPDNIDYECHLWVKDPRDSERTASAVIDVINDFYTASQKAV